MHRNYDNAGPDIPGLAKDFSPDADTVADGAVADMIAFDQLGPLTRAAMTGMCVQLSALGVLQLIRQRSGARFLGPIDQVEDIPVGQTQHDSQSRAPCPWLPPRRSHTRRTVHHPTRVPEAQL